MATNNARGALASFLQWGRGLGAAECPARRRAALRPGSLQWGRGLGAAECHRRPQGGRQGDSAFNGAAA